MKALLDTNVLYPTVMREVLLGVAATGAFTPLWSARILEEWARAARKLGVKSRVALCQVALAAWRALSEGLGGLDGPTSTR